MSSLADKILKVVANQPGITDRWLAEAIFGPGTSQQRVNSECRYLERLGQIKRTKRNDGLIGNYSTMQEAASEGEQNRSPSAMIPIQSENTGTSETGLSEDGLKKVLETWLIQHGWETQIAWARTRGIDIVAEREDKKWIIEAKGNGSLQPMRVNYFLCVLGELLQRMNDTTACYSIALPDMKQYRNLWTRLPSLAKERTGISVIFVNENGSVDVVR